MTLEGIRRGCDLGWDAANVEAGATQGAALLNAHGLHPQLGRLDGGHISAGASAQNHQVALATRCGTRGENGGRGGEQ